MTSQVVELLQQLIRNQCVNFHTVDSGHEYRSVATLQDFFGVEGTVVEPAPGRQSLVFRIKGTDPEAPSLALLPHIDVVPADPSGWSVDPFAAEIVDGFVYGRGALDMLNVTAAMAAAVKPYVIGDLAPSGDLVFAAVADEEAGGVYGAEALAQHHWDLAGADYVLTEVAYPALAHVEGPAIPVSVGEKGGFWSLLESKGRPGHGSAPYGADNALIKMVEALHGIIRTDMPVAIVPEWVEFVKSLDIDGDLAEALTDPDTVDDAIDRLAADDPLFARYAHAITHMTVSPNLMSAGVKANVVAAESAAYVDIRALPGADRDDVDSHLRKAMGHAGDHIDISPVNDFAATVSPTGNPLWEAIGDSVEELEGHRRLLPTLMNVATDARFWRARGSVGYGVGLFDDRMSFSEMLALFHGHDERVSVDSLEKTTILYETVLRNFPPA
jgi:acetylornithine deacetylase/succinyl-diaminopimelate desuccinylase-like protein